jgi:hypothetical protein
LENLVGRDHLGDLGKDGEEVMVIMDFGEMMCELD